MAELRIDTLRIESSRLDALMQLGGELVVSHGRIARWNQDLDRLQTQCDYLHKHPAESAQGLGELSAEIARLRGQMSGDIARLEAVATQLEGSIRTGRLLPLATLLDLFPRMVHDLAAELGTDMVTCCPLIDGHNYSFEADYMAQWRWLEEGIAEAARVARPGAGPVGGPRNLVQPEFRRWPCPQTRRSRRHQAMRQGHVRFGLGQGHRRPSGTQACAEGPCGRRGRGRTRTGPAPTICPHEHSNISTETTSEPHARATTMRPQGRRGPVFGDADRRVLQRKAWVPEGRRSVRPSPKRTCPGLIAWCRLERRV